MIRFGLAALLILLPSATLAQDASDCSNFMAARQIAPPPEDLREAEASRIVMQALLPFAFDSTLLEETFGVSFEPEPKARPGNCSFAQMAAMTANLGAIPKAVPVNDPAELHGTWVSDDLLTELAGLTLPGQEMLVIGPILQGPGMTDGLDIRQFWLRVTAPNGRPAWSDQGEYFGLVAHSLLLPEKDGGYRSDFITRPTEYANVELLDERTEDLFLKSKLNIFDQKIDLALNGDTLVLHYRSRMPVFRPDAGPRVRTYHRVAPGAPDTALRMVAGLNQSQRYYFDCLTRKISARDPGLQDLLAPLTIEQADALLREEILLRAEQRSLLDQAGGAATANELKTKMIALSERAQASKEKLVPLQDAILHSDLCPNPDELRIGAWP